MQRVRNEIGCDKKGLERYSGKDITVAVLDTGIMKHPDFSDRIIAFQDFVHHRKSPYDDAGHGTHVAGCLAGSGLVSAGRYRGVAPGCNLVIGKILDRSGGGDARIMLKALHWIVRQKDALNIRVLNISIGFEDRVDLAKIKELLKALEEVWRAGILIIVAAGNKGPGAGSISPLGMGSHVLTVGCHDGDYSGEGEVLCAEYSGRGPSTAVMKKPDLVAPGTRITATSAKCRRHRNRYEHAYEAKSGTSFAAPLVAGAAALLLEKEPQLKADEIKRRLCYCARDLKEPWGKQGWGMLDVTGLLEG